MPDELRWIPRRATAYMEGREAYANGDKFCKYSHGSTNYAMWWRGWRDEMEERNALKNENKPSGVK